MSKVLHMTTEGLPLPESVNHYTKIRIIKGRYAQEYKTKKAQIFEKVFTEYLENLVEEEGWAFDAESEHHWYLDMTIYFDRKGKDSGNYDKQLLDAMNDLVFPDDKFVHPRVQAVYYDSKNPRIVMTLRPTTYTGIFPNESSKEEFLSICQTCTRYREGRCSIIQDSITGKMREELTYETNSQDGYITHDDIECTKYKEKK